MNHGIGSRRGGCMASLPSWRGGPCAARARGAGRAGDRVVPPPARAAGGEVPDAAAASGKPRGLTWNGLRLRTAVKFARDRTTGQIVALVPVTIAFEAVEGGPMEGVAAVGNLRNATAVFAFDRGHWTTGGKAVFNLNPDEALKHFQQQYEPIH